MQPTDPASPKARLEYHRPTLSIYGPFQLLSASGSGSRTENNRGMGQPFRRP